MVAFPHFQYENLPGVLLSLFEVPMFLIFQWRELCSLEDCIEEQLDALRATTLAGNCEKGDEVCVKISGLVADAKRIVSYLETHHCEGEDERQKLKDWKVGLEDLEGDL
jgi:20S proteasome alpha/beta subunit